MSGSTVRPRILVVMGVSGSGKSTVALHLHKTLGWVFQEGDELHPKANVAKMSAGIPLDDEDRKPWLAACAAWIRRLHDAGEPGILTCSALKRSYRETIAQGFADVWFLYVKVPPAIIKDRIDRRSHHYMPSSLLQSQLNTLEEPGADEQVIAVEARDSIDATMQAIFAEL